MLLLRFGVVQRILQSFRRVKTGVRPGEIRSGRLVPRPSPAATAGPVSGEVILSQNVERTHEAGAKGAEGPAPRGLSSARASLVLVLMIAAGLRVLFLGDAPFEYDELWTAELSTGRGSVHLVAPRGELLEPAPGTTQLQGAPGFWRVWTSMGTATHPPLYFLVLGAWRALFGEGVVAARSLSVVASVVAVGLTYDLARRCFRGVPHAQWAGVVAATVMALAGPQVNYAQQARNYAVLAMASIAAACVLVRVEEHGASWRRLVLLSLALLAAALTHYFSLGVLLAFFVYAAVRLRSGVRWKTLGAFGAAGAAFLVAWGPFLLGHVRTFSGDDATTEFLSGRGASWGSLVLSVPLRMLMKPPALDAWVLFVGLVLYLAPWILLKWRRDLLLPSLWLAGAVGFVAMLDLARDTSHLGFLRYVFLAGPPVCLLVAGTFWHWKWGRFLLPGLAVVACGFGLGSVYQSEEPQWKALAETIDEWASVTDVVVFHSESKPGGSGDPFLGYSHFAKSFRRPVVLLDRPASDELLEKLERRRVWLVLGHRKDRSTPLLRGWRSTSLIRFTGERVPVELHAMSRE